MTKVTFFKEKGRHKGFSIEGHACFNVGGPDILCSAISMASQMTANGLEAVAKVITEVESGDGMLTVKIASETNDITQALIESFYLAIENLYEQYSEFMTLSRVGWSDLS